jgi:hypothetical protein
LRPISRFATDNCHTVTAEDLNIGILEFPLAKAMWPSHDGQNVVTQFLWSHGPQLGLPAIQPTATLTAGKKCVVEYKCHHKQNYIAQTNSSGYFKNI